MKKGTVLTTTKKNIVAIVIDNNEVPELVYAEAEVEHMHGGAYLTLTTYRKGGFPPKTKANFVIEIPEVGGLAGVVSNHTLARIVLGGRAVEFFGKAKDYSTRPMKDFTEHLERDYGMRNHYTDMLHDAIQAQVDLRERIVRVLLDGHFSEEIICEVVTYVTTRFK